jgi:hypothetical protein
MKITVAQLNGRRDVFNVHCDETLGSFRERISKKAQMPLDSMQLIFYGKELVDRHLTLLECNVTDGSLMFVCLRTKLGTSLHLNIFVNVVTSTGRTIALIASRRSTISDIKSIICSEANEVLHAAAWDSSRALVAYLSAETINSGIATSTSCTASYAREDVLNRACVLFHAGIKLQDDCVLEDISAPYHRALHLLMSPSQSGLTPELLMRISSSPPNFTSLEILGQSLGTTGCQMLANALRLNSSITSVNLHCSYIGPAGASVLLPAVARLTSLTLLCLSGTLFQSEGAFHLCAALSHLTALTELDVGYNELTANDGARIISSLLYHSKLSALFLEHEPLNCVSRSDWRKAALVARHVPPAVAQRGWAAVIRYLQLKAQLHFCGHITGVSLRQLSAALRYRHSRVPLRL